MTGRQERNACGRGLPHACPNDHVIFVHEEPDPARVRVERDGLSGGWYDLWAIPARQDLAHGRLPIEPYQGRRKLMDRPEASLVLLLRPHDTSLPAASRVVHARARQYRQFRPSLNADVSAFPLTHAATNAALGNRRTGSTRTA